jgi:hypothetical protein
MFSRSSLASKSSFRSPRFSALLAVAAVAAMAPAVCGCEIPMAMLLAGEMGDSDSATPVDDGYYDDGGDYGSDSTALQVKNASAQGDLGNAVGFSGQANSTDAYDSYGYTDISIWVSDASNQWATMHALNISNGGLGSSVFKPGAKLHFSSEDYNASPYVYGWGCSGTGADATSLDYEASGSETDIEVSEAEDPGLIHLAFTVTYPGYPSAQVVHGELDIATPVAQ